MMSHADHSEDVQLSHRHCGAVCKEVGERLSSALGSHSIEPPAALLALMSRLAEAETQKSGRSLAGRNS